MKSRLKKIKDRRRNERGAALAIAVIIVAILSVVALTALTFSSTEARIAGSDLQRTQAFYASSSALEKMTNDFSDLFRLKMNPTTADLNNIANSPPPPLLAEGFTFQQTLAEDSQKLSELRTLQGLPSNVYPLVNIPDGPYAGLYSSIIPYKMSSTATLGYSGTQVKLEREFNNYLVPLFQFGIFSNEDIEIHPGPLLTFNGRIHSNKNIYALSSTRFLNRVTAAGEFVRNAMKGGETNAQGGSTDIWFRVNGIDVQSTLGNGSMTAGSGLVGGPNIIGSSPGQRGYYPGSPNGVPNPSWETESVMIPVAGDSNRFGGMLLTRTTGATELKLPLETGGSNTAELIKRALPSDGQLIADSRYYGKAEIRILIDDKNAGNGSSNVAGIPAGKGVLLENSNNGFNPLPLASGGVLRRIDNGGAYLDASSILQKKNAGGTTETAITVRGVKNSGVHLPGGNYVPPGSGIEGRILIEVVKPDGTTIDVTQTILSLGMTEGEPNGIVYLQRPLWAAFVQGSRDRTGNGFDLVSLTRNTQTAADGEIVNPTTFYANRGFINPTVGAANEDAGTITREYVPPADYNQIVPINIYNVREGWVSSTSSEYDVYQRGITSVVELNMRNLARWLDGVYDSNLLAGTNAVSANIRDDGGYVVYVSDRRGDRVKTERLSDGSSYNSTNGIVDNEDIYGSNGVLDLGEDIIDFGWNANGTSKKGTLQKDTSELPDSGTICCTPTNGAAVTDATRVARANAALSWANPNNYFRRAVRLFDGETLSTSAAAGKLSSSKGITVSSENMIYIWGNFNTTGITGIPTDGSTLNDGGYTGAQVPASIVGDAFFPLSKTWFDALSAFYPEGSGNGEDYRMADENLPGTAQSTSVRAGIIAGTTISTLTGTPGRDAVGNRRNGGIHNFPRFLELWGYGATTQTWNYTGSFVPLYHSTQAVSQHEDFRSVVYTPPRRNWSFDTTFLTPQNLPPGTPFFQYIQATSFRQSLR